jgi:hypothetical protein
MDSPEGGGADNQSWSGADDLRRHGLHGLEGIGGRPHLVGAPRRVGMGPIPVAAGAARTSDTPSLIVKGNGLLMAWKGVQVLAGMDCGARRLFSMLASIQTRVRLSQAIGCSSSRVFSWVSWHIPSILSLNVVHDVADTRLMQSLR